MEKMIITILFIIVTLMWGTTWLAMQISIETIPPIFATGIRFLFSSPILILIALIKRSPLFFEKGQRKFQFLITIFYFIIPFSLMIYGEKYVSSGLASIIFANMPVAILITSIIILNEKTNPTQITGLVVSIICLSTILLRESKFNTENQSIGIIALIIACIMHAIIYTQCKKKSCIISVITFNTLPSFFSGMILTVIGWFLEKPQISNFSVPSILSTIYLGNFAGIIGITCYFALQRRIEAFKASLVFLMFPVISIGIENYIYGYSISMISKLMLIPLSLGIFILLLPNKHI